MHALQYHSWPIKYKKKEVIFHTHKISGSMYSFKYMYIHIYIYIYIYIHIIKYTNIHTSNPPPYLTKKYKSFAILVDGLPQFHIHIYTYINIDIKRHTSNPPPYLTKKYKLFAMLIDGFPKYAIDVIGLHISYNLDLSNDNNSGAGNPIIVGKYIHICTYICNYIYKHIYIYIHIFVYKHIYISSYFIRFRFI
jgi:hypothetical protein